MALAGLGSCMALAVAELLSFVLSAEAQKWLMIVVLIYEG